MHVLCRAATAALASCLTFLLGYGSLMTTFVNFAELAVQYGYATLFAAAFPLSPIMAMLNNYIKIRYAMLSSLLQTC